MEWDEPAIDFGEDDDLPKLDYIHIAKMYCYECKCGAHVIKRIEPEDST
ncbi:MAG: hypothetical protein ACOC6G_00205 [Thermoproteota archaeon]